jgi:pimeloyl-ACP methyl ester carboxylesterase
MLVEIPETRFVKTADGAYLAYKVVGEGSTDLVYVPGWNSRLDLSWEQPLDARFVRSLASFSRLIMLDRRGSGLADSVLHHAPPPLEVLVDDIKSVLDAVGSEKATVFGEFEGGPHCALFAATYPARTRALVLYATYARGAWAPITHGLGRIRRWKKTLRVVNGHSNQAGTMRSTTRGGWSSWSRVSRTMRR